MKSRWNHKRAQMVGLVFNRLTVLEFAGLKGRSYSWKCRCVCGNETVVTGYQLRAGKIKSCGCLVSERMRATQTKHGMSRTPEYNSWYAMLGRCATESANSYNRYGGRGITVCERWKKFENFIADMGRRPSKEHSLDRINNDGNYEPSNCRWATKKEQNENTSIVKPIGGFPSMRAAAMASGVPVSTLAKRLRLGWSVERALTTPPFPQTKKAA